MRLFSPLVTLVTHGRLFSHASNLPFFCLRPLLSLPSFIGDWQLLKGCIASSYLKGGSKSVTAHLVPIQANYKITQKKTVFALLTTKEAAYWLCCPSDYHPCVWSLQVLDARSSICRYLDDNSCSALIILGFVMMSPLVVVAAAIFCGLLRRFRLLLLVQPITRAWYRGRLLDCTGGFHSWVWSRRLTSRQEFQCANRTTRAAMAKVCL